MKKRPYLVASGLALAALVAAIIVASSSSHSTPSQGQDLSQPSPALTTPSPRQNPRPKSAPIVLIPSTASVSPHSRVRRVAQVSKPVVSAPVQEVEKTTNLLAVHEPQAAPAVPATMAIPRPNRHEIRDNWHQVVRSRAFDPRREKSAYRACDQRECALDPDKAILVAGVQWHFNGHRGIDPLQRDVRRGDFRLGTPAVYVE